MKKSEILEMEAGTELDWLVAEKIFLCEIDSNRGDSGQACCAKAHLEHAYFTHTTQGDIPGPTKCRFSHKEATFATTHYQIPSYSTSIADAWEVETKIFDNNNAVSYINHLMDLAGKDVRWGIVKDWYHWFCVAHATPLERCRAALLTTLEAEDE